MKRGPAYAGSGPHSIVMPEIHSLSVQAFARFPALRNSRRAARNLCGRFESVLRGTVAILAVAFASGCATITGSEVQNLSLQALDQNGAAAPGAECRLTNDKGTWSARPPTIATVMRSAQDLLVQCEAKGREAGTVVAVSRANSGMFGNIIFGGGVGALIDHNRGTAYDYPSNIRVVFGATLRIDKSDEPEGMVARLPGDAASTVPVGERPPLAQGRPQTGVAAVAPSVSTRAGPPYPVPGMIYRYSWVDRRNARQVQEFSIAVAGLDGETVYERFAVAGLSTVRTEIDLREQRFIGRLLASGASMIEFAPYFAMGIVPGALPVLTGSPDYPHQGYGSWRYSAQAQGWEPVSVPAGTYRALRVDVQGHRSFAGTIPSAVQLVPERFAYSAWYAPEIGRYIKVRHQSWTPIGPLSDELVELLEVRSP